MVAREEPGQGARQPQNLVELFEIGAARRGAQVATRQKREGRWTELSWSALAARARDVADGLAALGVQKGDRVAVIGETTTEWIVAGLGIGGAAAVTVPVYQSSRPHECQYLLANSGARYVFCDGETQVAKIREVRERLPELRGLIRFSGAPADGFERTLAELEAGGASWRRSNGGAHAARLASLSPEDPATIIYTSGTTGNPKGVVLTHGNWLYEAAAVRQIGLLRPDDRVLLFLPMAHVFAQAIAAIWFECGCEVAFVESIEKIVDNAGEVHPTVMPAVPRIFEKAYNAAVASGLAAPGLKGKLFQWALDGLAAHAEGCDQGRSDAGGLGFRVGKLLVFPKVGAALAERFGGRMRLFISGSAPLSSKIARFFRLAGFEILEGYGLTESSAATCVNRPGRARIGTVGQAVPGTEVQIAPDGEILIRGGGVMRGYHENPQATAEALQDGWLLTGDIGELDADRYLKITDRKKDIIATAGGKKVAPQNLEGELKTDPLISQVMVHGDRRKFLSALVTLNEENVRKWLRSSGAAADGPLHRNAQVRARIQASFDALNSRQPSFATIKKFVILERDLSQEAGELTPTLKVKRKFCGEKYRDLLDALYAE